MGNIIHYSNNQGQEQPNPGTENRNPGTISDIHKECKNLMPNYFEGVNLILFHELNKNFMLSHSVNLKSNSNDCWYRFGATFLGQNKSKLDLYPIIHGEISTDSSLKAFINHTIFNDRLRLIFAAESLETTLFDATYFSNSSTFSAILYSNLFNNSGAIVLRYLKNLNKSLTLGFEFANLFNSTLPLSSTSIINEYFYLSSFKFYMRYLLDKNSILCTTLDMKNLQITYFKQLNSQLKFGIELMATNIYDDDYSIVKTYTKCGYEIVLPNYNNLIFRNSIDSNWNFYSILEKKLQLLTLTLSFGALLKNQTNKIRLGFGVKLT